MALKEKTKNEEINNDEQIIEKGQIVEEKNNSQESTSIENKIDSSEQQDEQNILDNKEIENNQDSNFKQTQPQTNIGHLVFKIFENIILSLITILAIAFTVFTVFNTDNSNISSGISILGVDVSGLDKETATDKISSHVQKSLEGNDIVLRHKDFETNISTEQIEAKIHISSAIDAAYKIGSGNNIFSNSFKKLSLLVKPVDIKPVISLNKEQLNTTLSDISTQLPDAVKQSNYYIEGNNLIVTSGKAGVVIDNQKMIETISAKLNDLSYINCAIDIATINKEPEPLSVEKIYNQIHKQPVDAHYDPETHIVYPEENGLDFKISLEEATAILTEEKEEYTIPLQTLKPSVTTNMIGMEAFPDLLSTFSTKYPASNKDRTTNLKLAAGKVNGTVLLPGQTFSYNTIVGERTIAAGYKEAAVYQDGQVVQGLGGGICQISTTLYNAALYANLEIVERRNHQFVPSYIGAGRDATVVYGSQDFKFTNNRNYAIKITCSVDKGVATFSIYGLKETNDYEVAISSSITSRGTKSLTSATYKTLKQNGQVVSSTTISRDTYKVH